MRTTMLSVAVPAALLIATLGAQPGDGCSSAKKATLAANAGAEKSIVETAVAAGDFGTLATALKSAGLVEALNGEGPFTVFAPTDAAFAQLPAGTLESLLKPENRETLKTILTYHVVPGRVPAAQVVELGDAVALNGQRISIDTDDQGVRVADVDVVKTDIECSNGIIHVVDAVMMPATKNLVGTAVEAGSFETLAKALTAAGLVETLSGDRAFTVFAPTDEAFAALPAGTLQDLLKPENKAKLTKILTYHVVPGRVYADQLETGDVKTVAGETVRVQVKDGEVKVGGARVRSADIETTNGVIHVIDTVLLPD